MHAPNKIIETDRVARLDREASIGRMEVRTASGRGEVLPALMRIELCRRKWG